MKRISLHVVFFVTLAFSAVAVAKTYDSEPKRSYESIDVVLYRVSWWPYCSKAREFLRETGVSLTEHDVENNLQKREEMKAKSMRITI